MIYIKKGMVKPLQKKKEIRKWDKERYRIKINGSMKKKIESKK